MLTGEQMLKMAEGTLCRVLSDALGKFDVGSLVSRVHHTGDCRQSCHFKDSRGVTNWMNPFELELVVEERDAVTLGIARPVLEERKLGKISIELFDEGFPNAVMAVGEVMTWAAEHKGYKPHDWKNLPESRTAFLAAASRHRVKRHIQHVSGVPVEAQVDEESNLLHLAHEAFNVLAQLELAITNRLN